MPTMKTVRLNRVFLSLVLFVSALTQAARAAVAAGDVLRFDFNNNYTETGWNSIGVTNSQTQLITLTGNAIRFSDGTTTGVSLAIVANGGNGIYGESTTEYTAATSTGFGAGATKDLIYFNNNGLSNALKFRFSGLNDALTYTINIFGGVGGTTARPVNNWTDGTNTVSFNPKDNVNYVTLGSVTATGGIIDLSAYTSGTGAGIINAIEVVAVSSIPEPSQLAMAVGAAFLGVAVACRRR